MSDYTVRTCDSCGESVAPSCLTDYHDDGHLCQILVHPINECELLGGNMNFIWHSNASPQLPTWLPDELEDLPLDHKE